jgi:hypothetical protein
MINRIFKKFVDFLIKKNPIDYMLGRIFYGNNASFSKNLVGKYVLNSNRRKANLTTAEAIQLNNEGWVKLDNCNDVKILESLSLKFKEKIANVSFDRSARFDFSSQDNPSFFDHFEETLALMNNKIKNCLAEYYSERFTIINVHIYRILKIDSNLKNNSASYGSTELWHNDGSGVDRLKVFIPLDRIGIDDGPMQFIDKSHTKKIIRKNILLYNEKKVSSEIIKNNIFKKMLFEKKNAYIINTNECLHRATSPNSGYRDLLVYYCASSKEKFSSNFQSKATNNIY